MTFTEAELRLWDEDMGENGPRADDRAINERYSRGEGRIVIETNREKLPGFVSAIKEPGYMDLRPFYQRRPRWNTRKQSLLIESFIMNIPVPPIFLYERDYNSYEVMDGQQRVTAIRDFYENRFALSGLEMWSELNGRFYHNLPDKLRAGIDRRSITSIVLLKESTSDEEDATFLRETVFERLNTGGVELERQEIRNALFQGKFNDLLFELSRDDNFRAVWGVPRYVENEIDRNPELFHNTLYSKMGDIEIILRFFALRHAERYRRGMQGFLDLYMMKGTKAFGDDDIRDLRNLYQTTFSLAHQIYEGRTFCPFNAERGEWEPKAHRAFYDAVMVGISSCLNHREQLLARKDVLVEATERLFRDHPDGTFTGRGNTKADVQERIGLFTAMLEQTLRN
jgi:hypothetical protein